MTPVLNTICIARSRSIVAIVCLADSGGGGDPNQKDASSQNAETADDHDAGLDNLRPIEIRQVDKSCLNHDERDDHQSPTSDFSNPEHGGIYFLRS